MRLPSLPFLGPLLATLLLVPACAPPDVDGSWEGEWRTGVFTGSLSLDLTQDGDAFEGSFDIGGTGCVGSGDVEGTLNQRKFHAVLRNGVGGEVLLDGDVGAANERIDGDFEVTGGWCDDASGRFELRHE